MSWERLMSAGQQHCLCSVATPGNVEHTIAVAELRSRALRVPPR
jgi:hypothetical protein